MDLGPPPSAPPCRLILTTRFSLALKLQSPHKALVRASGLRELIEGRYIIYLKKWGHFGGPAHSLPLPTWDRTHFKSWIFISFPRGQNHSPAPQLVRVHGGELVQPEGPSVVGAPKGDIASRGLERVRLVVHRLRLCPGCRWGARACIITIDQKGGDEGSVRIDRQMKKFNIHL